MRFREGLAAGVLFLLSMCLAGGCQSQGEKTVESFTNVRRTLVESQNQVDATIASLSALRTTPTEYLRSSFSRYKDDVSKLEAQGEHARFLAKSFKEQQDVNIHAWQKEQASITDPAIKASLESRQQAVQANFARVKANADEARKAYEPFLQRNKQIVQALSIDLSPAAISSLSGSIDQALADGKVLQQKLAAMQRDMDNIANGVSPSGGSQ